MRGALVLVASLAVFAGALVAGTGSASVTEPPPPILQMAAVNHEAVADGTPRSLSEYGFFANAVEQVPNADVIPYRLNTPLYSDGAQKLRFVYLPANTQAMADGDNLLTLPVGAALIKTFAFGEGRGAG